MATNIMQETEEFQGLQEAVADPTRPIFSPEQCRILGQVYQMILGLASGTQDADGTRYCRSRESNNRYSSGGTGGLRWL